MTGIELLSAIMDNMNQCTDWNFGEDWHEKVGNLSTGDSALWNMYAHWCQSVLLLDNVTVYLFDDIINICGPLNILVLRLPQYLYDSSPIELAFALTLSKLKREYSAVDSDRDKHQADIIFYN